MKRISKALGIATGADQVARIGGLLGRDAGRVLDATKAVAQAVTDERREPDPYTPDRWSDAAARFEGARQHYGATDESMRRMLTATRFHFWLFSAVAAGIAVYGTLSPDFPAWGWSLLVPALAYVLNAGCANWVVRRRSADGLGAYLRSGDWLPRGTYA